MKSFSRSILPAAFLLISIQFIFANPPDWVDDPGAYEFTATISGGVVLNEGIQMGDEGDMFAAFDADENVRGVGIMLIPPFGPYQGTPVFEVQLRSNAEGDLLHFSMSKTELKMVLFDYQYFHFVGIMLLFCHLMTSPECSCLFPTLQN